MNRTGHRPPTTEAPKVAAHLGEQRGFGMAGANDELPTRYDYAGERSRWGSFPGGARRARPPKGYVRTDERIREDICERLAMTIDASDVEVRVVAGVVTFIGTVEDRYSKFQLEEITDRVIGVKDIHNQVTFERVVDAPRGNKH
jgi:hypothetical protein